MTMEMQAPQAPQGHTMTVTRGDAAPLVFTEEQRRMIRDSFANGASDAEFAVLMEIAKARRLNPLLRQVHFVSRWDSQKGREVWATQVSIDGLRAVAERTGLYSGQDEPEFEEGPDGSPKLCRVKVYRKDWPRPAVGVAYWSEYVQTRKDKATGRQIPTSFWQRMPHTMLAKCAESLALRKAFPEDTSGLYTPEEMGQAENDRPEEQPAESPRRAQVKEQPAAAPSAPQEPTPTSLGVSDLCASIRRCRSGEEVAQRWIDAKDDVRRWSRGEVDAAWHEAVAYCAELREVQFDTAYEWLVARIKELTKPTPPGGGGGGTKPAAMGSTSAQGSAAEGTPANDSTQARELTRVSDAASALLERHGSNPWALRNALKKHREELHFDDVPELARALARITPEDPVTKARLTLAGAEAIVRGLTGLRQVAKAAAWGAR